MSFLIFTLSGVCPPSATNRLWRFLFCDLLIKVLKFNKEHPDPFVVRLFDCSRINDRVTQVKALPFLLIFWVYPTTAAQFKQNKIEGFSFLTESQLNSFCNLNVNCHFYLFSFQERGIDFGLEVMPCSDPPGVKIFGYAPQFNAKNFSHIFVHGNDYEIPGKSPRFPWDFRQVFWASSNLCRKVSPHRYIVLHFIQV